MQVPKVAAHNLKFEKGRTESIEKLHFLEKRKENEQRIGHFTYEDIISC
jgi:hypothetical protein